MSTVRKTVSFTLPSPEETKSPEASTPVTAQNLVVNFETPPLQPSKFNDNFPKTAFLPPKNGQLPTPAILSVEEDPDVLFDQARTVIRPLIIEWAEFYYDAELDDKQIKDITLIIKNQYDDTKDMPKCVKDIANALKRRARQFRMGSEEFFMTFFSAKK